jgi:hypothetical protein
MSTGKYTIQSHIWFSQGNLCSVFVIPDMDHIKKEDFHTDSSQMTEKEEAYLAKRISR